MYCLTVPACYLHEYGHTTMPQYIRTEQDKTDYGFKKGFIVASDYLCLDNMLVSLALKQTLKTA